MFGLFKKEDKPQNGPKSNTVIRVPVSVQDSIPFKNVYANGIIEDYNGRYSKTYPVGSTNFDTLEETSQESMFLDWEKVINLIDNVSVGQLTIINKNIDMDVVRNDIMLKPKTSGNVDASFKEEHDILRGEMNEKFASDLRQGRNNIKKDAYLTVSVPADDVLEANSSLARMDAQISKALRKIIKAPTKPLNALERLELFYDYYNSNEVLTYAKKTAPMSTDGNLDLEKMKSFNIHPKDVIGPSGMKMGESMLMFGSDQYVKTYFIDTFPTELSTNFINDVSDLPCNMVISISWTQMDVAEANQLVKQRLLDMNGAIGNQQSKAADEGVIDSGAVSSELMNMRDEAQELMDDIRKRNMKCFLVTPLVTLIASSKEELKSLEKTLKTNITKFSCHLRPMEKQMENAFNSTLPLAQLNIADDRFMQTEATAVFIPFSVKDLNQAGGIDYGVNPISHNIVRINRYKANNYNGLFVGQSGSGKSFAAKMEILQKYLGEDHQILIIDPEGEYVNLGKAIGAEIIKVAYNSTSGRINPMDMDITSGDGGNPIPSKCDELITLISIMMGGEYALGATTKNVIIRAVNETYKEYYHHMLKLQREAEEKGTEMITCDRDAMPTLANLYSTLIKFQEPEAQYIAAAIENHCVGDGAMFSTRTTINPRNQMIIFDISEMSDNMKNVAMQVTMSYCWNRIIENGNNGIFTDLYIDEFHLFTKNAISAAYMKNIYKRARKWKGSPTAITQNINDLMVNDEARAIFDACSFICILNQAPLDRQELAPILNLSEQQLDYITDQPPGYGLIYNGSTVVPFENSIDESTEIFKLIDSRKKDKKNETI